jgi:Domain of unknown function (DUF1844)
MSDSEKPKIIVDEDWKAQVQAEKEAATAPGSGATDPVTAGGSSAAAESTPDHEMPAASLMFLCTTIATQAMIALGQVPNPITGKVEQRMKQAKHYIDTLAVLDEKTTGNRTADESALLSEILHQLRMAYVMLQGDTSRA